MNNQLYYILLFIGLILLQVLVLNNILLFDHVNPYLYIAFIFTFPFQQNRFTILTLSFFLGLCIDFFCDSGGIHAFSSLLIGYLRLYFFKIYFQKTEADFDFFNIKEEAFGKIFNYVASLTVIHHLFLFLLINFSLKNLSNVFLNTILSSVFTLILYFLGTFIFAENNKD